MTNDEAIRMLIRLKDRINFEVTDSQQKMDALNMAIEALSAQKQGEWNFIGDDMFECTECGILYTSKQLGTWKRYTTDVEFPNYCPNCGADMRGEENNADSD